MPDPSACEQLRAAQAIIATISFDGLGAEERQDCSAVAACINHLLSHVAGATASPAIVAALRMRWREQPAVRIDEGALARIEPTGLWVMGWLLAEEVPEPIEEGAFNVALGALPVMAREVYLLHRVDGREMSDIAFRLGLAPVEVERLLFDALRGLHKHIYRGM